jgi:hypothetical protein
MFRAQARTPNCSLTFHISADLPQERPRILSVNQLAGKRLAVKPSLPRQIILANINSL